MIPVFKPLIEQEEYDAARQALELGWLGMGSYVSKFEDSIKELIQAPDRHVAAVSTGTAALHVALLVAGVGPGDEVVSAAFNCSADFQVVTQAGAELVFCDTLDDSLCIDLDSAEKMVTPKTKAIIVMDYDCILCDHDRVAEFAKKHNLRVIHDAAHSFGSKYKGKMVGSFSDICVFSFDPVKTITCLDGGAVIVKTKEELKLVHELRLLGMQQPAEVMYQNKRAWTFDVERQGFRYHMINMHAAMGLAQIGKIEKISRSRREASRYYNAKLANVNHVRTPNTDFNDISPFLYYIRVPAEHRDNLRTFMKEEKGVDTGIHWIPGHHFTLWKNCRHGDLSVTNRIAQEILSLPLHSMIATETLDEVVDAIAAYFAKV